MWSRVRAWSARASATSGWAWPSETTASPPRKSRYSRPSLSHSRVPSPGRKAPGSRAYVCMTWAASRAASSSKLMTLPWDKANGSGHHHGAHTLAGEALQEQGVGDAAVEEVGPADAVTQRRDARGDLGDHPFRQRAVAQHGIQFSGRDLRDQ